MNDPKPCNCGQWPIFNNKPDTYIYICLACHACTPTMPTRHSAVRVWNAMMQAANDDFAASVKVWPVRRCVDGKHVGNIIQTPMRANRHVTKWNVATRDIPAWECRVNLCNAVQVLEANAEHKTFTDDGFTLCRP